MVKTKLSLEQIREHNQHLAANKVGKYDDNQITDSIQETLPSFAKEVFDLRHGLTQDAKGNQIKAMDIPFDKAVKMIFGCDLKTFMRQVGIFSQSDSIGDVARRFGAGSFNVSSMEDLLTKGIGFGSTASTKDIASDFRFIIPELITTAIRLGYEGSAMHMNWVAMTQNMSQTKLTMPYILRGDGVPSKIAEGANIPVGSLKFGKKEVSVFKVGTGFVLTDELIYQSSIDMLFTFLAEVGLDMGIASDIEAMRVLVNGEQADGSESAPVVGVNVTASGFTFADIKRVTTRMKRLKHDVSRLLTGEEDGINITGIDRFEGFAGDTRLATINSIIGVPDTLYNDVHILPTNQVMFLAPKRCMAKLQHKSMTIEKRRNPENQTEELYVTDWIGFAKIRRDAAVLLDKSVTIGASGFPSYMDIDARINVAFNNF